MKKQSLISESTEIANMDIDTIISEVSKKGISEIILLDLAKIGSLTGGGDTNYQSIQSHHSSLKIILGGGVKDINDINTLEQQGFNGALIATSLHKGIITPENVRSFYESI